MDEQSLFEVQFDERDRNVIRTDFEPGNAPRPFAPEAHVPFDPSGVGEPPEPVINPRIVTPTPLPNDTEPEEGRDDIDEGYLATRDDLAQGPIEQQQQAADGHLAFDSFMGEVVSVNYGATKVDVHSIVARRSRVSYGTNNDPKIGPVPAPDDDPQKARLEAFPFPTRHDQAAYIVEAGDPVLIFTGKDGRHYFISDELPFVGRVAAKFYGTFTAAVSDTITQTAHGFTTAQPVILTTTGTLPSPLALSTTYFVRVATANTYTLHPTAADASAGTNAIDITDTGTGAHNTFYPKESHAGGAGLLCLRVLRQAMSADPKSASFQGATLAALQDADSVNIYVNNVLVIAPETHGHGYRVGDKVIVQRRGSYYFILPGRETFIAEIQTGGPDGEADFATNHYWVREQDTTVTYDPATPNQWTYTNADRSQLDPLGLSAWKGRWVDALNLAEGVASHDLLQYTEVIVVMAADPATGEVAYFFDHSSPTIAAGHTVLNDATHTDTVGNHAVVRGDLIVGNSTPKWDALAKGNARDILSMAAAGTDPAWEASIRSCVMSRTSGASTVEPLEGTYFATNYAHNSAPVWWHPYDTTISGTFTDLSPSSDRVTVTFPIEGTAFLWYCTDTTTLLRTGGLSYPSSCYVITDHEPNYSDPSANQIHAIGPEAIGDPPDPSGGWDRATGCDEQTLVLAWSERQWIT